MNEGTVFVLLVLGSLALALLARYLRARQRLRLHEMAHQERMLALEKGLPVSDIPCGSEFDAWLDGRSPDRLLDRGWDRRITLGIGLVMLFASIGGLLWAWLLSFTATRDAVEVRIAATAAVIPLMASLGMLLYHRLTAPKKP
jgi:hypothetical protein